MKISEIIKISYLCLAVFFGLSMQAQTVTVSNTTQFLNAINNMNNGSLSASEIILEANTYSIPSTINLTSAHSGLKISGCEGVFINGGIVLETDDFQDFSSITPGFTLSNPSISNSIKVYDLATLGINVSDLGTNNHHGYGFSDEFSTPSMLWLDEDKMELSRWPNKDAVMTDSQMILPSKWEDLRSKMDGAVSYYEILETGTKESSTDGVKFTLDESLDAKVNSWSFYKNSTEEIWMDGVVHSSWEWEYNQVADITNGEIKMQYGPNSSFTISSDAVRQVNSKTKVSHFHFENIPEELDTEGEYFIDRENMLLYFYPPSGWENKKLTLSILNGDMFSIVGATGIILENLVIEAGLKNGIVVDDASSNNSIDKCIIRNFNQWGIRILGTNNVVDNCEVYNVGGGGVKLGLEKKTFHLDAENNVVQNSTIHDIAWDQKSQVPGITLSGCGNKAIGNEIYDAPHFGIKYRQSRECVAEKNKIHDLPNYHYFDGGALYVGLGNNFYQRENLVKNNTFYNIPTNGVYLDNYTMGNFVEGNAFYNVGNSTSGANYAAIYNHGGGQSTYKDNVAIDCKVFIKTGSHVVRGNGTSSYKNIQSWYNAVQSGAGFYKPSGLYYMDFTTKYNRSDLGSFIDILSDLPTIIKDELPGITSSDQWKTKYEVWDQQGYEAMQDETNSTGINDWQQWRNYFQIRYQSSTMTNNLSLNTDPSKIYTGGTGTYSAVTLGDGKVFWEFSPYFDRNSSGTINGAMTLHSAKNNEALSTEETTSSFPNLVSNNLINESSYSALSYSGGNLLTPINLNLENRGDKVTTALLECNSSNSCNAIGLESFKYQTEVSCIDGEKNDNYTAIQKDESTLDYSIDLSSGIDSKIITLFFLVDWDTSGQPNGSFDAAVANFPDKDFIRFDGSHTGFQINSIDKLKSDCWNWNRRVNVEIEYIGTDFNTIHELGLTFNPNNNLLSKNNELYCSQRINLAVKINDPSLSVGDYNVISSLVYPNPVKGLLTISNIDTFKSIEIYTILGTRIKSIVCDKKKVVIDLSEYSTGVYLINIKKSSQNEFIRILKE